MADKNENVNPTMDVNTNNIESEMETHTNNDAEENGITKDSEESISKDSNLFKTPTIQFKMPEKLPLTSPITNLENENKAQNLKQIKTSSNQESPTPKATKEKNKTSNSSPAESLQQAQVIFPYKEPNWSGLPEPGYSFEILKNGAIIENIELKDKAFYVFGRLPSCDVTMEHPSLSRYHAVIQYCKNPESSVSQSGWYLYDLDSTHGTWLNKNKVKPNVYHRIRVGHVVKFGGSTRLHILQGPETDQEEESELSVTEIKQQRDRQKREAEVLRLADADESDRLQQKMNQDEGCSWGMGEEAEEEAEEVELVSNQPDNEELYIDDPKKALKGFYEREGCDLPEYIITDGLPGKYKCRVDLPVDGQNGEALVAEVMISGKKKEAVVACALEACRILDRHQLLRQAKHESRKRKSKNWEADDFYDSDEDEFLDRTGTIAVKRKKRMVQAGKVDNKGDTYEILIEKHKSTVKEIDDIEARLQHAKDEAAKFDGDDIDALDAYMSAIKAGVMDTKTKMQLKRQLIILRTEEMRLRKLVNIAKPASLPDLKQPVKNQKSTTLSTGNMKGLTGHKPVKKTLPIKSPIVTMEVEGEEVEEEEEEEEEDDIDEPKKQTIIENKPKNKNCEKVESESSAKQNTETKVNTNRSTLGALSSVLEQLQGDVPGSNKSTSSKIKGPSTPSEEEELVVSSSSNSNKEKSRKKHLPNQGKVQEVIDYDASDPDYAVWLPPEGQSGDGKTHLNDKYGY
ncbi:hypothetical protein SNE40_008674 [Patella caerulea]|uniref:FHA domain-containing protein n=1 Tax=Patella caerulea TaxID=87958 RepID=A0AAN8JV28_PATCE